ncbi:hypothetical protein [Paenibacillus xylanexedens]|uniref:hypothetical protein n=1 Tax=Paenibacillus xylanexedens TaxID=528191 RepID=UPI000F530DD3|nr:hypothetical protein [Paenibacillus xylanexedens]
MPTFNEIVELDKNYSFAGAICKNKGFREWANYLNLEIKDSCSKTGIDYEFHALNMLESLGYKVEKMALRHPFDLLINNCVKIDVKVANPKTYEYKSLVHTFATNKPNPTCDIYLLFALDVNGEIDNTYIVPSVYARVSTIEINANGKKYHEFAGRWDLIEKYVNFFNTIK